MGTGFLQALVSTIVDEFNNGQVVATLKFLIMYDLNPGNLGLESVTDAQRPWSMMVNDGIETVILYRTTDFIINMALETLTCKSLFSLVPKLDNTLCVKNVHFIVRL